MDNVLSDYGIEKDREELEFYRRLCPGQKNLEKITNAVKRREEKEAKIKSLKELLHQDSDISIDAIIEHSNVNSYFKEQLIRKIVLKETGSERVLWFFKLLKIFKM